MSDASTTPAVQEVGAGRQFGYDFVIEIARTVKNGHLTQEEKDKRHRALVTSLDANFSSARVAHNARSLYTFYELMQDLPVHEGTLGDRAAPFHEAYLIARESISPVSQSCNVDEKSVAKWGDFEDEYRRDVARKVCSMLFHSGDEYRFTTFMLALLYVDHRDVFPFNHLYEDVATQRHKKCILSAVIVRMYELNLLRAVAPEQDFGEDEFPPLDRALQYAFPLFHTLGKIFYHTLPIRLREIAERRHRHPREEIEDLARWGRMCVKALYEELGHESLYARNEYFTVNDRACFERAFHVFR